MNLNYHSIDTVSCIGIYHGFQFGFLWGIDTEGPMKKILTKQIEGMSQERLFYPVTGSATPIKDSAILILATEARGLKNTSGLREKSRALAAELFQKNGWRKLRRFIDVPNPGHKMQSFTTTWYLDLRK